MPKKVQNSVRISVFFSPEHIEMLKKVADEKGTTVSALIRMITIEALIKK